MKSISSSALNFLYSLTVTSIHDNWISSLRGPKLGNTQSGEPTLHWAIGESQHDSILRVQGREHWPCGAVCNVGMPSPLQIYRKPTYPFRSYSNATSSRKPSLTSSLKSMLLRPLETPRASLEHAFCLAQQSVQVPVCVTALASPWSLGPSLMYYHIPWRPGHLGVLSWKEH